MHFSFKNGNTDLDNIETGAEWGAAANGDSDEIGLVLLDRDLSGGHRHAP